MSDRLVSSSQEIVDNVLALVAEAAQGSAVAHERLARGRSFVPVRQGDGQLVFGPSRYVGYAQNSLAENAADAGGGGWTNYAISRQLGAKSAASPTREREFIRFCQSLGIKPRGHARRYWPVQASRAAVRRKAKK